MKFLYHRDAAKERVLLEGEEYRHLFKSRRHKRGELLLLRNMKDGNLYRYKILEVDRKFALLQLEDMEQKESLPLGFLRLGWCVIDPKTVEKSLPMLNEIGVSSICFVYCERSQRNFRLRMEKLKKILISSSQQCGRSRLMELEVYDSLERFLSDYPDCAVLDFGGEVLENEKPRTLLVGCEGGFSQKERELFKDRKIFSLRTDNVLKSETAAVAAAAKILL